ncbi:MAG: DNA polymerase Y family protein [Myxococcales bacterium]|nr:DNA polymerase Y family protein [Myxococcales bacterium]
MGSEGGLAEIPWRVAYLGIPHFALTQALLEHPEAQGLPVALVAEGTQAAHVAALNQAAAAAGVTLGQTASHARARCPLLCCLPWDATHLADVVARITAALQVLSPLVVPVAEGPGGWWLDARGMRLLGGEPGLVARARALLAELGYPRVHLGVADTASAARALALHPRPPEPPVIPPGGDAAFLGRLPLEALELEPEVGAVLRQLGVQTVDALRALPAGALESRFGPAGRAAVERALARDARRPRGSLREPLPEAVLVLEQPVDQTGPLIFGLRGLLDPLAARLVAQGLAAQRLALVFSLDDGSERTEVLDPVRPLHHPAGLFELLRDRLERLTLDSPAVELRVRVLAAQPIVPEQVHLDAGRFDPVALDGALNRLRGRFGEAVVMVPRAVDDHRPEAAGRWEPVVEAPVQQARGAARGEVEPPSALHRALATPTPVEVRTDAAGRPTAVRLGGRWRPAQAHGPERLSGRWWEGAWAREDWRVAVLEQVLWISREAEGGFVLRGWWD